MYKSGYFYDWVPKWAALLLLMIFQFAFLAVSGIYTTNISYMAAESGSQADYFMWGYYANAVGMGIAMPLMVRVRNRFRVKEIVSGVFILLAAFSYIIGTTTQPYVIVLCSLAIGFFKMFGSMQMLIVLMFIVSPDGNRGKFYSIFYPYVLCAIWLTYVVITEITYRLNWQIAYMYVAAFCLVMSMLAVIFMHNHRSIRKVPLYYIDWLSAILFAVCFMSLAYVFAFGKSQDWFSSDRMKLAFGVFVMSTVLMSVRQVTLKRPYLSFRIFEKSNVRHGLLMLFFTGMFLGLGTLQTVFCVGVLGYDYHITAEIYLLSLPGIVFGGYVGYYWFRQMMPIKFYILLGFASYTLYCVYMYFGMVRDFSFSMWVIPMFLRGFGMCILFISIWYYTLDKLNPTDMLAAIGLIIVWRSFVSIGLFTAFFSWLQYLLQWQSISNLALYMDANNLPSRDALAGLRTTQINAVLGATKEIFGYVIIAGIGVMLYVYFHHFGRIRFTILRFRRSYIGKQLINKRRRKEEVQRLERKALEEEMGDSAGAIL